MRTRTYYRGPDAVVTSEVFVWRTTPPQVFAIRELRRVGVVHGSGHRTQPYQAMVLTLSMWPMVKAPVVVAIMILAATVPLVAVAAYRRTRSRRWEIHAHYRGDDVLMYASRDERVFNQVARALRRAMEDRDPHYNGNGAAAA